MRRILSILIIFTILLSLAGCGGGREAAEAEAAPAESGVPDSEPMDAAYEIAGDADPLALQEALAGTYRSRAVELPEGMTVSCITASEEKLYAYGSGLLCELNEDGAVVQTYELTGGKDIVDMAPAGGGDLWLLAAEFGDAGPETGPVLTGGTVCRYTPGGDISVSFKTPDGLNGLYALCSDPALMRLYVIGSPALTVLDYEGNTVAQVEPVTGGAMTADGQLAAVRTAPGADGQAAETFLQLMGTGEAPGWEGRRALDLGWCSVFDGRKSWDLYLSDGLRLYGVKLAAGAVTPLLTWLDAGVDRAFDVLALSGSRFLVRTYDGLRLLEPVTAEEAASGPITVTVAAVRDPGVLEKAVLGFNNAQDRYKAVIRDYSQYNEDDHDTAGLERLGLDIAAGDGPDVIELQGVPAARYVKQGVLADLYPLLDADPDLRREDMDPRMLSAMETDGALYEFIPMAKFASAALAREVYEAMDGLTYEALTPERGITVVPGDFAYGGSDRYQFLTAAVSAGSPFVDWENGTCDFDSPGFRAVLAIAAAQNDGPYAQAMEWSRSTVSLTPDIWTARDFAQLPAAWDIVVPGMPGKDGTAGSFLVPVGMDLGICEASPNKDGAWTFLRWCMMEGCSDVWATPLWTKHTWTDEPPTWEELGVTDPAPYEAAMEAVIDSVAGVYHPDTDLVNIVRSEAAAYFDGAATVDETAAAIQARASLYVAEQS